ncbi:MAG: Type 1 glutamine amidotransferase-like domain-containing protein [Bacillus sp. (in: firmicutes)]
MNNKHLFLFGGSPPFSKKLGGKFAAYAMKNQGKVVVLYLKSFSWKLHKMRYTKILKQNGLVHFVYISLINTPLKNIIEMLESCTGIIICGGKTELYRNYIVETEVGEKLMELYQNGIPIAGFSAGALICPTYCIIPPKDTAKKEHLFLKGLGLLKNCVVTVHFSKWHEASNLQTAISKLKAPIGFGIDDGAGVYFENDTLSETEGVVYYMEEGYNSIKRYKER